MPFNALKCLVIYRPVTIKFPGPSCHQWNGNSEGWERPEPRPKQLVVKSCQASKSLGDGLGGLGLGDAGPTKAGEAGADVGLKLRPLGPIGLGPMKPFTTEQVLGEALIRGTSGGLVQDWILR